MYSFTAKGMEQVKTRVVSGILWAAATLALVAGCAQEVVTEQDGTKTCVSGNCMNAVVECTDEKERQVAIRLENTSKGARVLYKFTEHTNADPVVVRSLVGELPPGTEKQVYFNVKDVTDAVTLKVYQRMPDGSIANGTEKSQSTMPKYC